MLQTLHPLNCQVDPPLPLPELGSSLQACRAAQEKQEAAVAEPNLRSPKVQGFRGPLRNSGIQGLGFRGACGLRRVAWPPFVGFRV